VPLIRGILASFDNPLLGAIPTIVLFQYNPVDVTRVFRAEVGDGGGGASQGTHAARNQSQPSIEEYTIKLELDATDGLAKGAEGAPLTTAFGVGPRLAAIEMLMQPVGESVLGGLAGGLLGGGGAKVPAGRTPLVLFIWGPTRIAPVRLRSLTIRETSFDELLNPIHATADLGFGVLRPNDPGLQDRVSRAAAKFYQAAREVKAVLQLPQMLELDA
jgi:hypothetical protein